MTQTAIVVGLGWIGQKYCAQLDQLGQVSTVIGVDVDEAARQKMEAVHGIKTEAELQPALAEHQPDVAIIATPNTYHYDQARTVIDLGLDVLVEKPMTTSTEEAILLLTAAREQSALLQVGYHRRFHPVYEEIRRLISEGELGEIRSVNCAIGQGWLEMNRESWRTDPGMAGGGQLFDTGSHLLEALLWTTAATPTRVTGLRSGGETAEEIDLNSALAISFDSPRGSFTASVGICSESTDMAADETISVWGTDGRLSYDGVPGPEPPDTLRFTPIEGPSYTTNYRFTPGIDELVRSKLQAFLSVVDTRETPPIPGERGLTLAVLRDAIREAWETDRTVNVAPNLRDARNRAGVPEDPGSS